MPNNNNDELAGLGQDADQYLMVDVVSGTPESKTRERPPSCASIGIVIPSPYIPPSSMEPEFFSQQLAPEFFSLTDRPKIFHYKIEPEFIGLLFGIRIISSIPKLLVEGC